MKFTDEEKDEIAKLSKTYWREIIIVVLFIATLFCYVRWNETKKDLVESVRISTFGRTLDEINSGLDGMKQREKEEYPKIDTNINDLNTNINMLNESLKKVNKPNKDKTNETFKKQTIQDRSKWFASHGYPNTISTGK